MKKMGREIRRVPTNWEHPKDEHGNYMPMHDADFETEAQKWMENCRAWDEGWHDDLRGNPDPKTDHPFYWQWTGNPPNAKYYRPKWREEERRHYQIYETVTEGTPTSPVFASLDELSAWLVAHGHSEEAATKFAKAGWVPTGFISPTGALFGIDVATTYDT